MVYIVTSKIHLSVYVGNTLNTLKNRMEQKFQDMLQKLQHDKSLDTFAANFAKTFNKKSTIASWNYKFQNTL